jgi:hypothetical protein
LSWKIIKGIIGYYRFPELKEPWGGAFNGQEHRRKIFSELSQRCRFDTIVETGTYRGSTTELFATMQNIAVYSIESDYWSYGYCLARFWKRSNVKVLLGDSGETLVALAKNRNFKQPFCYLDAHWGEQIPLRNELNIILETWPQAVVMIDDFKVEDDPGYGFDDYGDGKQLSVDYIKDIIEFFRPRMFYPRTNSYDETGARRGCIVLFGRGDSGSSLALKTLREI